MDKSNQDALYFSLLPHIAERSTCLRGHTSALIIREGRIVSMGYNGAPPGAEHCAVENGCNPKSAVGCLNSIHAEANAIAFAARVGIATLHAEMYCMSSPCMSCAKLIVSAGLVRVHYNKEYRAEAGRDWFENVGVDLVAH